MPVVPAALSEDSRVAIEIRALVEAGDMDQARERFGELVALHQRRASRIAYQYLRDEIIEMVGQPAYYQMVILLERPKWTPLPHPATRR